MKTDLLIMALVVAGGGVYFNSQIQGQLKKKVTGGGGGNTYINLTRGNPIQNLTNPLNQIQGNLNSQLSSFSNNVQGQLKNINSGYTDNLNFLNNKITNLENQAKNVNGIKYLKLLKEIADLKKEFEKKTKEKQAGLIEKGGSWFGKLLVNAPLDLGIGLIYGIGDAMGFNKYDISLSKFNTIIRDKNKFRNKKKIYNGGQNSFSQSFIKNKSKVTIKPNPTSYFYFQKLLYDFLCHSSLHTPNFSFSIC